MSGHGPGRAVGPLVVNIDTTLVEVHSGNKAGVVPYFKGGCGFRPVVCSTADGEPPSGMLRASDAAGDQHRGPHLRARQRGGDAARA